MTLHDVLRAMVEGVVLGTLLVVLYIFGAML